MDSDEKENDTAITLDYGGGTTSIHGMRKAILLSLIGATSCNGLLDLYLDRLSEAKCVDFVYYNRVLLIGHGVWAIAMILGILFMIVFPRWRPLAFALLFLNTVFWFFRGELLLA